MNTPTPRTDTCAKNIDQSNFEDSWKDEFEEFAWVPADFARQLERELTAVTEQRDEARFDLDFRRQLYTLLSERSDRQFVELCIACVERDRLVEALRGMLKVTSGQAIYNFMSPQRLVAKQALQS